MEIVGLEIVGLEIVGLEIVGLEIVPGSRVPSGRITSGRLSTGIIPSVRRPTGRRSAATRFRDRQILMSPELEQDGNARVEDSRNQPRPGDASLLIARNRDLEYRQSAGGPPADDVATGTAEPVAQP